MAAGKATLMVVEDEKDILLLLRHNFERAGFRVVACRDAEQALAASKKQSIDLFVLDVMLPTVDGFELCRRLREKTQAPILFLSGKAREVDRVLGLRLGADDYMAKPYSADELLARVQALLRRSRQRPAAGDGGDERLRAGGLEIDGARNEVRVNGQLRPLTPKEFELLTALARAEGKTISREGLLEQVWGHEPGLNISTRTVDQHVARLRRKLRSERKRLVTVRGRGYKLAR